tara:strand:- start:53 stop:439 length:387 start_codon:yes stop_codon:yes gene_type:complete
VPYKNKEDRKKFAREYYKKYYHAVSKHNPKYIEREKKRKKKYRKENLEKRRSINNYYSRLYKVRKKQACPSWANLEKIKEIYLNCPKGFQIDHIIPLNNSVVCGLHVEYNLQYLPALENQKKSNKFDG